MSREVIIERQEISLFYHPNEGIVHHQVHMAVRGEPFRTVLLKGADLLKSRGGTKWLSDDRLYFVLPEEDEEWARTQWVPKAQAAGWKYWAVVKPETAISQLNVGRFIKISAAQGITATMVADFDDAWSWLVAQGTGAGT